LPNLYFQVVRQNEADLKEAINDLCDGTPTMATEQLLRRLSRPLQDEQPLDDEQETVKLHGTIFDADFVNHDMLDDLGGEERSYRSEDEGKF
jgi:hypothetical protein